MTNNKSYAEIKDDVLAVLVDTMTLAEIYHKAYVGQGKKPPLRLYSSLRNALNLMADEGLVIKKGKQFKKANP